MSELASSVKIGLNKTGCPKSDSYKVDLDRTRVDKIKSARSRKLKTNKDISSKKFSLFIYPHRKIFFKYKKAIKIFFGKN